MAVYLNTELLFSLPALNTITYTSTVYNHILTAHLITSTHSLSYVYTHTKLCFTLLYMLTTVSTSVLVP